MNSPCAGRVCGHTDSKSRRNFLLTLGTSVSTFLLKACGGGGGGALVQVDSAIDASPAWSTVPTITFVEGVPGSLSIAGYVSYDSAMRITKNQVPLPAGVKFDAGTMSFIYDGLGTTAATEGHVLTATPAAA